MAGNPNQKKKLLCVLDILMKNTDENHPIDAIEMCEILKSRYNIDAERKGIYDDIAVLSDLDVGFDIIKTRTPKFGYYIASREFEEQEVYLLVDAVESANFLSEKKTRELIKKLETLVSTHQAKDISKRLYIENRNKCSNEDIYHNIDKLNRAISTNKRITTNYVRKSLGENNRIVDNVKELEISPYALVWENDNYYVIGNVDKYDNLIHLRIDRMKSIVVTNIHSRHFSEVSEYKSFFDVADYVRKSFNMFGGELKNIELRCFDKRIDQVVDRFGDKLYLRPNFDGTFSFTTKANISDGLISWLLQFGDDIEVISPPELREKVIQKVKVISQIYKAEN